MKYETVKSRVNATNRGAFRHMVWEKELHTNAANKAHTVTKRTAAVVRFGIRYDNMKAVQEQREKGMLPAENAGLPWGEWIDDNFISHKGNKYLRCITSKQNKMETQYFLDGKAVDRETAQQYCIKSDFSSNPVGDVFNVNIDNIIEIR